MSNIEWTEKTWNPTVGCSKVSAGCQNCYAIKDAHRMAGHSNPKISSVYAGLTERRCDRTEWTGKVTFVPERLQIPLKTRKPTRWFVNSMSDLFHEQITDEQLDQIFAVMALTPQHTYQCLTKRPKRMLEYFHRTFGETIHDLGHEQSINRSHQVEAAMMRMAQCPEEGLKKWPLPNVWLGVSVEDQPAANSRIPLLLETPAALRFLSCEPLLGPLDLTRLVSQRMLINALTGSWNPGGGGAGGAVAGGRLNGKIGWVIAGGESGPKARPCHLPWITEIVKQCNEAGVPCFVKQLGSNAASLPTYMSTSGQKKGQGKMNNPEQWPHYVRVRQLPGGLK